MPSLLNATTPHTTYMGLVALYRNFIHNNHHNLYTLGIYTFRLCNTVALYILTLTLNADSSVTKLILAQKLNNTRGHSRRYNVLKKINLLLILSLGKIVVF